MNEFVEQFLIEGRELVTQGSDDLLALEENTYDRARLDSAFRAFHTLKGAAGIVDFVAMARAVHAAEDRLSAVRAGTVPVTPALIGLCLRCLDQVGAWLDQMATSDDLPAGADDAADALIRNFQELSGSGVPTAVPAEATSSPTALPAGALSPLGLHILKAQRSLLAQSSADEGSLGRLESAARVAANVLRHHGLDAADLGSLLQNSLLARDTVSMVAAIDRIVADLSAPPPEAPSTLAALAAETTLRVDTTRIDSLVRLTGELIVAKNAIGHSARSALNDADPRALAVALKNQHLVLERLVNELQQSVFSLRVLPLHNAFQRFPRLVREMAASLGKPARLMIEGATTEADKSIVEAIAEPLLHVLRNAIDHGLESPAEREAAGKPATATIHLRAARQGDRVVVEVEDDGRGIDVARVREAARAKGLRPDTVLDSLSDDEIVDLIFAPGFSTATQVTDLSGRGVGMDVVRTIVERLGGRVTVGSRKGAGTVVRFLLPFTVMMTTVLTVEAAGQVFGVPMGAVIETVRVARQLISPVGSARALVVRDRTLPVIDLARALGNAGGHAAPAASPEANVLVVSVDGELAGLEVERLGERFDVMLKPPEGLLAGVPAVDGTTLLGDGRVLIVLDLHAIFEGTARE